MKLKNSLLKFLVATLVAVTPMAALTIDTSSHYDGVTVGWGGAGQSFTVDAEYNHFDSLTVFAVLTSAGETFDFRITDALNFGNTLFSTSFTAVGGANKITIDQSFAPGTTIFAQFDFNGYRGNSLHWVYDVYSGGTASFGGLANSAVFDNQSSSPNHDLRFVAEFSKGVASSVPDSGAMFVLFGASFAGLVWIRRQLSWSRAGC